MFQHCANFFLISLGLQKTNRDKDYPVLPIEGKQRKGLLHMVLLFVLLYSSGFTSRKSLIATSRLNLYFPDSTNHGKLQPSLVLPPPISEIYRIKRPPTLTNTIPFTTPQVLSAYSFRHNRSSSTHDLSLYASGIKGGGFRRNFGIVGCLVGNLVYPAYVTPYDVITCTISQPPSHDAKISIILRNDAILQDALSLKPIPVRQLNVTLPPGVIVDLPSDAALVERGTLIPIDDGEMKMLGSNITWSSFPTENIPMNEMKSEPRYHVCLITMINPFAESLRHWVSYHRAVGVDKVFIMDNNSNYTIKHDFENREDVEIMYWPFERSQVQGMTYMLHAMRARCKWIISADVDEYVMTGIKGVGQERPLQKFLQQERLSTVHMTKFGYIEMIGNRSTPAIEPMPIAYTHQTKQGYPSQGKSACRTDYEWKLHMVHDCYPKNLKNFVSETNAEAVAPENVSTIPKTVHYRMRSWEEFKLKTVLGSVSTVDWKSVPSDRHPASPPQWFRDITKYAQEWTKFRDLSDDYGKVRRR